MCNLTHCAHPFYLGPSKARSLVAGCRQGRDAPFMARLGHIIIGVDASLTGITNMNSDIEAEDLKLSAK